MRPARTYGEVARAVLGVASQPLTVRQIAAASCVGMQAARYTASRLVAAGELVRAAECRPVLLVRADAAPAAPARTVPHAALERVVRSFFDL
jgi:hypothetical protein